MRGVGWWILLAILFLIGAALRRSTLLALVFILALATGASLLWARYCLSAVTYRRRLGHHAIDYGRETTLALEFINAKPLPLAWLLVYDVFPRQIDLLTAEIQKGAPHRPGRLTNMLSLRWYERVVRTHRIRGKHRGLYEFGPAELSAGDIFGIHNRRRVDTTIDTLIVYPKVVPVHELGLPAGRPIGEWAARRKMVEDPLRFAMVREYVPGDNARHIHWPASARSGTLQTKVFDPSDTLSLIIALDVQTLHRPYEYEPDYLELAVSATASLALHGLDQRYSVGIYANALGPAGDQWVRLRPGRHPRQATEILTMLARLDWFRGRPYDDMLQRIMPLLPYGATIAAITAMPNDATYRALAALQDANHPIILLTIGDRMSDVPERFTRHHLGGHDAWHRLEALQLA
ncbi:MAG: DUF58 domain-containing protein [Anaerolineae bacterium]|jgi:uncharacterized protein (DUF58 family)